MGEKDASERRSTRKKDEERTCRQRLELCGTKKTMGQMMRYFIRRRQSNKRDERKGSDGSSTPTEVLDGTSRLDIAWSMEVEHDDDRQHVEDENESGLGGES